MDIKTGHYTLHNHHTWDKAVIITGDTNIDYIKSSSALETYNLKQHITISACENTKTIDHWMTNLPENKLISGKKFQTRIKYIRNTKGFDLKECINNFNGLPFLFSLQFWWSNKQHDTLYKFIIDCISWHVPLIKTLFNHPPAPWLKQLDISGLQQKCDNCCYFAHYAPTEEN